MITDLVGSMLVTLGCAFLAVGCIVLSLVMGAVTGFIKSAMEAKNENLNDAKTLQRILGGVIQGVAFAAIGGFLGKFIEFLKAGKCLGYVAKNEITLREWVSGTLLDWGIGAYTEAALKLKINKKTKPVQPLNPGYVD